MLTKSPTRDGVDAKPIPYAGLVYDLDKTYALYGSYSQIFQPQTQRDASGGLLKPVQGDQYEAGIKASYFDDRVIATFAFYSLTQQNRAMLDPSSPTPTVYFAQGKARAQGVEAEISGRVTDRWNLFAGYTFTDTKNYDSSTNIGGVAFTTIAPKHLFKLWNTYVLPFDSDKWTIGGGVYASSKFYTQDAGGQLVAPGYATFSASIAYKIDEHFTASVMVDNIFDKTYIRSLTGTTNGFYGDPRTFIAKLQAKW